MEHVLDEWQNDSQNMAEECHKICIDYSKKHFRLVGILRRQSLVIGET